MKLNYDKIYEDKNQALITASVVTTMTLITSFVICEPLTLIDFGMFSLLWGIRYFGLRLSIKHEANKK